MSPGIDLKKEKITKREKRKRRKRKLREGIRKGDGKEILI
jgi:hypothetical protein